MRVEGARVNRISAEGALGDGPEPDELATSDRQCFLAGGSPALKDLFAVDGGSRCLEGTLLCRVVRLVVLGGWVFFCLSRGRRHSNFSHEASVAIAGDWNTARRKRYSRRSATWGMVGVTEPEPCGLFVPDEDQVASVLAEHAQRRSLSVPFGGPAQQERPSPFLVRAFGLREHRSG